MKITVKCLNRPGVSTFVMSNGFLMPGGHVITDKQVSNARRRLGKRSRCELKHYDLRYYIPRYRASDLVEIDVKIVGYYGIAKV